MINELQFLKKEFQFSKKKEKKGYKYNTIKYAYKKKYKWNPFTFDKL